MLMAIFFRWQPMSCHLTRTQRIFQNFNFSKSSLEFDVGKGRTFSSKSNTAATPLSNSMAFCHQAAPLRLRLFQSISTLNELKGVISSPPGNKLTTRPKLRAPVCHLGSAVKRMLTITQINLSVPRGLFYLTGNLVMNAVDDDRNGICRSMNENSF